MAPCAEDGASPITACFSVGVFLLFLLLAAQVLLHLHTATVVAAVAHDAVDVAAGAGTGPPASGALAAGEAHALALLGGLVGPDGGAPDLDWQVATRPGGSRELELTITVASPSVAVRGVLRGEVRRSAVSTVEEPVP